MQLLATVDHLTQQLAAVQQAAAAAQQAASPQAAATNPEALAAMLAAIIPSVLEAVQRQGFTAAPATTPAAAKPFKDYLPQLPVYTGEASGLRVRDSLKPSWPRSASTPARPVFP